MAFYGCTYSTSYRFTYCTHHQATTFTFRNESFQATLFPKILIQTQKEFAFVNTEDTSGIDINVTSKERALVDVLDRPNLAGNWEEIFRSLQMIEYLKLENVIEYALLLANSTTVAKVGYFLSKYQKKYGVSSEQLALLKKHIPSSAHYMDKRFKANSQFFKEWNLVVPNIIVHESWDENLKWEPEL